jgi:hypothetical protein
VRRLGVGDEYERARRLNRRAQHGSLQTYPDTSSKPRIPARNIARARRLAPCRSQRTNGHDQREDDLSTIHEKTGFAAARDLLEGSGVRALFSRAKGPLTSLGRSVYRRAMGYEFLSPLTSLLKGLLDKTEPLPANPVEAWLRQNGYRDVADQVAGVVAEWARTGNKSRRNWWDVLAGDQKGRAKTVAGVTFPIIASIRARQGLPPIEGALSRPGEKAPPPKG